MKKSVLILTGFFVLVLFCTLHYVETIEKIMKEVKNIKLDLSKNTQHEEAFANLTDNLKLISDENQLKSMLCSLSSCPTDCDVCCNMPYHRQTKQMAVHHWIAATGLWNDQHRFTNLSLDKNSTVVYVGANNEGTDGKQIMDLFNCTMHMFEPVPAFFVELSNTWDVFKANLGFDATLHNVGLGSNDRTVYLAAEDLDGQGTFGMKDNNGSKEIPLNIREGASILRNITKTNKEKKKSEVIDLLHVNCEGCEWEMFDNLIEAGVLQTIRSVQFGSHYFPQVPNLMARYCKIKEHLNKTHHMVYGQSFGWERWDIKE